MKLFILTVKPGVHEEVVWDAFDKFAIAANDEEQARSMAQEQGQSECFVRGYIKKPFWTDPSKTDCIEFILPDTPKIVCSSFNSG